MGFMVSPLPYVLLVGGLEHFEHFPFHIWDVIRNPFDELHDFSGEVSTNRPMGKKTVPCRIRWDYQKENPL
jgi:hypothetical protein